MSTFTLLYHMARADLLERTRRYGFLVMLGFVVWLGYLSASGRFIMRIAPDYIGVLNAAWVGALMTLTVTFFLGLFGFYLVRGAVSRDYETGVGQIIATTPVTRPLYTLGKFVSNLVILGIMVLVLMIVGGLMMALVGVGDFNLWALVAPLLFVALPTVALVAALAVLFESVHWLRGGFGNIVYFIGFLMLVTPALSIKTYVPLLDFMGFRLIGDSIAQAAKAAFPESGGAFAFSITDLSDPHVFLWNGLAWSANTVLPRLAFVLIAVGITLTAALLFDRFDPSRARRARRREPVTPTLPEPTLEPVAASRMVAEPRLTPLAASHTGAPHLVPLVIVELRLLLQGQSWWWYLVAGGMLLTQLSMPLDELPTVLAVSWLWPTLRWSGLGSRETRFNTRQTVFSAPRPVVTQLPAQWLAAFLVALAMGAIAGLRVAIAGDTHGLLAFIAGALFIPSLALVLGVLTGTGRVFEAGYVMLWYAGPMNRYAPLDFVGITPDSAWHIWALLALGLLTVAVVGRSLQLRRAAW